VAEKIAEREVGFDEKIEPLKLNMEVE
jgi:hypothetical protein